MSHNVTQMAFMGSREDIWHRLGNQMEPGMTIEQWAKAAGLDWDAVMVPVYRDLRGPEFSHLPDRGLVETDNVKICTRNDTGAFLGIATDGYQAHQPKDVLNWFQRYIAVDPRFQLDVAGALKGGKIIWATATFNGGMTVGGDAHVARLLMTTTFDSTGATINQATMTRVVCNNTLNVALADKRAVVRTRHNTRFNVERVGAELATIAAGFEQYKAMGDAMAGIDISNTDISNLFKVVLDIPFDVKQDDISTRKMNQFNDLRSAYSATVREGTPAGTAWSALNAVTRYVDHDRSTKQGDNGVTEARFLSAQFGSGAAMKEKAVAYLYRTATERAAKSPTDDRPDVSDASLKALLAATPFRPSTIQ